MVQIIDISANILYDMQKADNKFLSLINACVSHELRNPLNSIIAQNIEKAKLYEELETLIDSFQGDTNKFKSKLRRINNRLMAGKKVQESSANLMKFLIQDFLDYAQIKAGKFRINNKPFDLREVIEKVMCIQMRKAQDQGIRLTAEYINILDNGDVSNDLTALSDMHSPIICADEDRLMQILLNL